MRMQAQSRSKRDKATSEAPISIPDGDSLAKSNSLLRFVERDDNAIDLSIFVVMIRAQNFFFKKKEDHDQPTNGTGNLHHVVSELRVSSEATSMDDVVRRTVGPYPVE